MAADYTVKRIDEMELVGPMKRARAELGVTSFGLQVFDFPPGFEDYPEHDHAEEGQEEVYVALRGSGEVEVDGERVALDGGNMIRIGPGARRKLWPGPEGIRILALGGVPGKAFEPARVTELDEPD
jgi:mannose-6-phosphate isomerase-like protein (cupin superfamily)